MKRWIYRFIIVLAIALTGCATLKDTAVALEPRLLWEKEFEGSIRDIAMAKESGDVIVSITKEVILYDRDGKEIFHWGPRIDRDTGSVDITADGSIVVFKSAWKETYKEEKRLKGWDERVHYVTRKGQEIWNKEWCGFVRISSDGNYLIMNCGGGEGQVFYVFDSKGTKLWSKEDETWGNITTRFSPDGKYIGVIGDLESPLMLMDTKDGSILWITKE